jgi:hypothetical protein
MDGARMAMMACAEERINSRWDSRRGLNDSCATFQSPVQVCLRVQHSQMYGEMELYSEAISRVRHAGCLDGKCLDADIEYPYHDETSFSLLRPHAISDWWNLQYLGNAFSNSVLS